MKSVARNVDSRILLDAFIILYVSYKLKYLQRNQGRSSAEEGGGGGVINKKFFREARPRDPNTYP